MMVLFFAKLDAADDFEAVVEAFALNDIDFIYKPVQCHRRAFIGTTIEVGHAAFDLLS